MFHTVFLKYICLINYDEFCNVQITGLPKTWNYGNKNMEFKKFKQNSTKTSKKKRLKTWNSKQPYMLSSKIMF